LINTFLLSSEIKFLNEDEKTWLKSLKSPLKVGITQIPNQVLKTKDGYKGYFVDLSELIEKSLGVKFKYVYYDSWKELLEAAKNKEVDILFFAQKTKDRLKYFYFTDIVLLQHNKILSNSKNILDVDVTNLLGKKVAVVKGSAIEEFIKYNFPSIKTVPSASEKDCLSKLLKNRVDFAVVEPVRTSYYMRKSDINDLHISGLFPYDYKLRIASRKDMPELNIILNKAIEFIDPVEKKALALKWGYEKESFLDKKTLFYLAGVFLLVLLFLFYLSLLNSKLKKAHKKLHLINKTLEERIKEEVKKSRQKDLAIINQSRFAQMGKAINMIAHQWRQPLNNLSILIQRIIIKCQKKDIDHNEIDKLKKKVFIQIQQMSKTIDDFRDFFKPKKEMTLFSLNDMIDTIVDIIDPIFKSSSIQIEVQKPNEVIMIKGYSTQLSQAILNILYNAKDALEENNIKEKKITLSLSIKDNKALIKIKDNAKGIKKEFINKIFDPYFSTKGQNGTGIGLYMTKIIIQRHKGADIIAYNDKEGAVFEITLPL